LDAVLDTVLATCRLSHEILRRAARNLYGVLD
jgi:hypothetical protein